MNPRSRGNFFGFCAVLYRKLILRPVSVANSEAPGGCCRAAHRRFLLQGRRLRAAVASCEARCRGCCTSWQHRAFSIASVGLPALCTWHNTTLHTSARRTLSHTAVMTPTLARRRRRNFLSCCVNTSCRAHAVQSPAAAHPTPNPPAQRRLIENVACGK